MIPREQADKTIGEYFEKHIKGEPGSYDAPEFREISGDSYLHAVGKSKSPLCPEDPELEDFIAVRPDGQLDAGGH